MLFLRIKYFFKTDKETRRADNNEYKYAIRDMNAMHGLMRAARLNITKMTNFEYIGQACTTYSGDAAKDCTHFHRDKKCAEMSCSLCERNHKYFDALARYQAQKQFVNNFWYNRRNERVE